MAVISVDDVGRRNPLKLLLQILEIFANLSRADCSSAPSNVRGFPHLDPVLVPLQESLHPPHARSILLEAV